MDIVTEVLKVVQDLNNFILGTEVEYYTELTPPEYEVTTDGTYCIVKYLGCIIFCSDNDYREWVEDEEDSDYEDLKEFLLKQSKEIIKLSNNTIGKL